jgi:hypothetical protein
MARKGKKTISVSSSVAAAVSDVIHQREEGHREEIPESDDVLVSLGDLSGARLEDVHAGRNFETIALDYITTFNMAIAQGVSPIKALLAMTQATSIVMGNCIRAGLKPEIALGMVKSMVAHAQKSRESVHIITKN